MTPVLSGITALAGRGAAIMRVLGSVAAVLVVAMAVLSRFDAHPDEAFHTLTSRYYLTHLLPPGGRDADLVAHLHPLYGTTHLLSTPPQLVYAVVGYVGRVLFVPPDALWIVFRALSVGLFGLVTYAFVWRRTAASYALVLLISGQLWYVFSYGNGDAWATAWCLLATALIADEHSGLRRYLEGTSSRRQAPIAFGVVLGLLMQSKVNVLSYLLFLVATTAFLSSQVRDRKVFLRRASLSLGVAALVAAPFLVADVARNGLSKGAVQMELRERYGAPGFKPSAIHDEGVQYGLSLRDRGVPLAALLSDDHWSRARWHKTSFKSFVGLYGYMEFVAPKWFYGLQFLLVAGLLAAMTISLWRRTSPRGRVLLALALACSGLAVGGSLYHSWSYDFQPQGRYLFPIFATLLLAWRVLTPEPEPTLVSWACGVAFILSSTSFVAFGLLHLV